MEPLLKNSPAKKYTDIFFIMLVFAFFIRLAISIGYYNSQDTTWYQRWAEALPDGLFSIYSRADSIDLDYPPVYLLFLYITGWLFKIVENVHPYTQMFLMKMWPVLGDLAVGVALYFIFGKKDRRTGIFASAMWLFNPAALFNSSFWGQTDAIMCLLLLLSFTALDRERPLFACFLFALAGLTKFQSLFFVPVFLLELFSKFRIKKFFGGIGVAAATVAAVFLPFMSASKNIWLFFDVYLKGQGKYPHCTLNAFNIYGIFGLNWVNDSNLVVGGLSYGMLSNIVLIVLILGLLALYIFAENRSVWVIGFLFMNSIFMFTTRMHERYQFVVMIFLLAAVMIYKKRSLLYCYLGTTVMIFANHIVPMFSWNSEGSVFNYAYGALMASLSFLNVIMYIISTVVCIKFLFTKRFDLKEEKL